jgi:hypothetical protein
LLYSVRKLKQMRLFVHRLPPALLATLLLLNNTFCSARDHIFSSRKPAESKSDFISLCQKLSTPEQNLIPTCEKISAELFKTKSTDPVSVFTISETTSFLGIKAEPIDSRILYLAINDPNYTSAIAYCYFVFREWIDSNTLTTDQIGLFASGFSITNEDADKYQTWLNGPKGMACKERVKQQSGELVYDLKGALNDKIAIIGINPLASVINNGPDLTAVTNDITNTLRHERLHAYQAACPKLDAWGREKWQNLHPKLKQEIAKKYPAYNWNDTAVAARLFIAFAYEKHPTKPASQDPTDRQFEALLTECKIP